MTAVVRAPRANWTDVLGNRKGNPLLSAEQASKADNRRWAHRRASATSATLIGEDVGDPVPCVILDSSSTGARIKPHFTRAARFQNIKDLPGTVTLFYTIDRVAIDCKVAWRRDGEVGLKFVSPARSIPKPAQRPMMPGKGKK